MESSSGFTGLMKFRSHREHGDRKRSPNPRRFEKYIKQTVSSFREVPPGPTQYDEQEERYKPSAEVALEDLKIILEAHDSDGESQLQARDCSWNTVFAQIARAREEHAARADHNDGVEITFGVASEVIDLIPGEYGLSIIKGALGLVFESIRRRQQVKDRILVVFDTIPETIITINTAFALLHPEPGEVEVKDKFLQELVLDLPALVKLLLGEKPWYKKIVDYLALHIPETQTLDEILGRWTTQTSTLKKHITRMKSRILNAANWKLDGLKSQLTETSTNLCLLLQESHSFQERLMTMFQELGESNQKQLSKAWRATEIFASASTGLYDQFKHMQEHWEWKEKSYHRQLQHSQNRQDELERQNSHLSAQVQELSRSREALRAGQSSESPPHPRATPRVTSVQLLGILGIGIRSAWDDLDTVLRRANSLDTIDQDQARWLAKTPEFQDWFQCDRSAILLCDGCTTEHLYLVSSMSVFCATLISSLVDDENVIALVFFSGLHAETHTYTRGANGPIGLIRSLCAQLLLHPSLTKLDLSFLSATMLEGLSHQNLDAYRYTFERLLQQVPPWMRVYCILDGIWLYERPPWLDDLKYLASMFESMITEESSETPMVKVLMTSPGKSTELVKKTRIAHTVWKHVTLAAGHTDYGVTSF